MAERRGCGIDQGTQRVTHSMREQDFVAVGRDIESRVLARAVKLHLKTGVILNGHKTIVFQPWRRGRG